MTLYVSKPAPSSDRIQVLGFILQEGLERAVECQRVSWSHAASEAFLAIATAARVSGDAAGLRLPYATLRALLSAGLPDPLYVASDLAGIGSPEREGGRPPFAECASSEPDCVRAAATAVRAWVPGILVPWAEARGVPAELVAALTQLALNGGLVKTDRRAVDLAAVEPTGNGFPDLRDAIHSAAFRRMAGRELFPGLGPAHALVRSRARDNSIAFVTFPKRAERGSWSMQVRLTVETLPGHAEPFVRLDVSRKRWCPSVPMNLMPRQRRIRAVVFGPEPTRAVSFDVPASRGKVLDPEDPSFALSALRAGVDPGEGFDALVAAGPRDGAFVGIPFAPAYDPSPSVGTGATELDWIDCHDAVAEAMAGILVPLSATPVASAKRVSRDSEDIPAVKAATILEDIARTIGHNEIDDDAIAEAWQILHGGELPAGVSVPDEAAAAARRFDELRESNTARVRSTFGSFVPPLVVLSADAAEGAAVADIVRTLFSARMRIEHRLLPVGVHGPRKSLASADRPARERYEDRVTLWKPFAEALLDELGPCRVLVHAPRFRDDTVNKIAGRVALARFGDCNVQYLDARGRKADEWFFRIQAAVLDLMFGHSGLVSPVADNVAEAFPDAATRPRSIVGISVVAQNRTLSRAASSFFLSVSVDVATGRTTARAGRPQDGTVEITEPLPFFDLLKLVSSWDGASVGSGETAKADYQDFVAEVVGDACLRGENPLVMFDGAHARNLWPTVSNRGWGMPHTILRNPLDIASDWPGARIVRVQDTIEPIVVTRKSRAFASIDPETGLETGSLTQSTPTLTKPGRLVRIDGPAANYVSSGDLDGQQKIAKGMSVYRAIAQFKAVAKELRPEVLGDVKVLEAVEREIGEEPYKLPGTIGILVVHALEGDDPDRVAALCHGLRVGFGHTRSPVRMPAPLFQARKVAEYIPAYVLEEHDGEDADEPQVAAFGPDEGETDEPIPTTDDDPGAEAMDDAAGDGGVAADAAEEASPGAANPLLLLTAARPPRHEPLGDTGMRPDTIPQGDTAITMGAGDVSDAPMVPDEMRALAGGDEALESLLERLWVGPLPEFADEAWMLPLVSAHVSPRARQQLADAYAKARTPMRRFLPDVDPGSEESFARFLLGMLRIADGMHFVRDSLPRAFAKGARRWLFNSIYDQTFRQGRAIKRYETPNAIVRALSHSPLAIAKGLHEAGHGALMRQYMALESLFMPNLAEGYASAGRALKALHGDEYAEVAAFCARIAAYHAHQSEVHADIQAYMERETALRPTGLVGRSEMPDAGEVAQLDAIPETPAPGIDAGWLRDKISLSGAFRSHLHAHRARIRAALGDPKAWPDEKPSTDTITACVARLFSVPQPLLAAVDQRDKESLFRPLYRKIESTVRAIEETRTEKDRLSLPATWLSGGMAPIVFAYLVESGYRNYAAELALVRAVDSPSLPLEMAVRAAGDGFEEIAEFVAARRRASIWFVANDERADDELFSPFVEAFEAGEAEATLPGKHGGTASETMGGIMTDDSPIAAADGNVAVETATLPEADGRTGPVSDPTARLAELLTQIARAAGEGATALSEARIGALDAALERLPDLVAAARGIAAILPRLVSNARLLERVGALGREATRISEGFGDPVAIPSLPSTGDIEPTAATEADGHIGRGEAAAADAASALEQVNEMQGRGMSVKPAELPAFHAAMMQRVEDVRSGLAAVANAISDALPALTPAAAVTPLADPPVSEAEDIELSPPAGEAEDVVPVPSVPVLVHDDEDAPSSDPEPGHAVAEDVVSEELAGVPTARSEDLAPEAGVADGDASTPAIEVEDAEDDEADEIDEEAIEELAASVEDAGTATHAPMASDPAPADGDRDFLPGEEFEDLEAARIDEALDRLMTAGSYGLAHHLARAAEIEDPDRRLCATSTEAKLAALAGHLNHTALQSSIDLVEAWVEEAHEVKAAIAEDTDGERAVARLMTQMPLALELAIFFPTQGAAELLRAFSELPGDLGPRALKVFESVDRIQHTNVTFSRAMLANVANELDCSRALSEARAALTRKVELFQTMKLDFQLANKIRNELNKGDNLVGTLRIQLQRGVDDARTRDTVQGFIDRVRDRARIVQIFEDAEMAVNDKFQGLDGVARNRLVAFFESFRDIANGYVELASEVEQAKHGDRPNAREFARQIARAVDGMIEAVEGAAGDVGRIGVAARHVGPRLRRVAAILSGEQGMAAAPSTDIYQAWHAELALVTELEYGRSWLPSPYDPARIIDLLCEVEPPLLPSEPEARDATFETAVRARMERGSYVGARMLLDAAPFFGIDEELAAALGGEVDSSVASDKEVMRDDIEQARRLVERVIRFGSLRGGTDKETNELLERIVKLENVEVPAILAPGDRTESESGGIYDVSVATDEIEDIKAEAQALLDEPRIRLERRIDGLPEEMADRTMRDRLRALCEGGDLLTAEEHIDEVEKTGRIPVSRQRNWRFDAFADTVLPALSSHRRDLAGDVTAALRDGRDFEGIAYGQLTDRAREDNADVVEVWRDLFRKFHDASLPAHLVSLLDKLGIKADLKQVVSKGNSQRKMFVGDFRAEFLPDQESLLLPDFGTNTGGSYRIVLSASLPTDAVIAEHCSVGSQGTILLVNDIVSPTERARFQMRNLAGHRRVLLVDSASIFFALGEPSVRPLTLVELAQPYSYVAPYKDWGREAVPIEMFVGRADDMAQIADAHGSNIVYGGRRMGKTAIFRQLVTRLHKPSAGMLVAFVDAQDIGRGNTATRIVWGEIATALPDIFGSSPPTDPKRVRDGIQRWLDEDERRNVLLLLDECDHFVVSDASHGYTDFIQLQKLMSDTRRRFKFVLAGLSNVTRLVQTGNPPLMQISANPRRIGSLTGEEREDAEDLVLRPFSALGLRLEPTDVWRILSHANYYPVLIQTYAQRLLQTVMDRVKARQVPMRKVPSDLVGEVLEDLSTRSAIKTIFEATLGIDLRYQFLAYIVAMLVFQAEAEGRVDDGFAVHEIREQAINFWAAGFRDSNRFSLFDDLLDEMEGLGIVRRVSGDRWTLRSTAVVRLLGNRDEILTAVLSFGERDAPPGFDPKSHRRILPTSKTVINERRASPLTLGQERDILLSKARATVVLGNRLADHALVYWALKDVPKSFSDGDAYEARALTAASSAEMEAALREQKVPAGKKVIAIVQSSSPWTADWVKAALNARPVTRGDVRVVFVGGAEHADSVFADGQLATLTSHVEIVPLEPWSTAFFSDMVNKDNVVTPMSRGFETIANGNGGWNAPMSQLFAGGQRAGSRAVADQVDEEALGLTGRFGRALSMLLRINGHGSLSFGDMEEFLGADEDLASLGVSARELVDYGLAMGILVSVPGRSAGERGRGRFAPSRLVASVLGIVPAVAAE